MLSISSYKSQRVVFYLLLVAAAFYFANNLFHFLTDLKFADRAPPYEHEVQKPVPESGIQRPVRDYRAFFERNLFAVKVDETAKPKEMDLPQSGGTRIELPELHSFPAPWSMRVGGPGPSFGISGVIGRRSFPWGLLSVAPG